MFDRRKREQATKVLALLLAVTQQQFIRPYALTMMKALLPKALDSNTTIAANVLRCLGELARVSDTDIMPFVPDIMSVIITRLGDTSRMNRMAALRALGQTCSSSAYVIQPLLDYPDLFPRLERMFKLESGREGKREVFRVIGILGVVYYPRLSR